MRGVVAHTGEAVDDDHHPLAGPQVGVEPVGQRALQQRPLELATLAGVELGSAAGAASGAQGVTAAVLPGVVPAVGVLAGGAEPVGDLGLAGALFGHAGGAQSSALHGFEVAALAAAWVCWRGCGHRPLSHNLNYRGDYGMRVRRPIWRRSLADGEKRVRGLHGHYIISDSTQRLDRVRWRNRHRHNDAAGAATA